MVLTNNEMGGLQESTTNGSSISKNNLINSKQTHKIVITQNCTTFAQSAGNHHKNAMGDKTEQKSFHLKNPQKPEEFLDPFRQKNHQNKSIFNSYNQRKNTNINSDGTNNRSKDVHKTRNYTGNEEMNNKKENTIDPQSNMNRSGSRFVRQKSNHDNNSQNDLSDDSLTSHTNKKKNLTKNYSSDLNTSSSESDNAQKSDLGSNFENNPMSDQRIRSQQLNQEKSKITIHKKKDSTNRINNQNITEVLEVTNEFVEKVDTVLGSPVLEEEIKLVACEYCSRKFAETRIKKHKEICRVTHNQQRKKYDATRHRVVGTDLEAYSLGVLLDHSNGNRAGTRRKGAVGRRSNENKETSSRFGGSPSRGHSSSAIKSTANKRRAK